MNKALLLLLSLPCFVGCRTAKYQADVGPIFVVANGDLALQNAQGTLTGFYQNELDRDLGVGDTEPAPYLRLQFDEERHRVRLHGFGIEAEGSGVLANDYGGIVAGAAVATSMDFYAIGANWGYQVWRGPNYRVAVGAQAMYYGLDVAARSPVGREEVATDVLVPMPFVEVEGLFGELALGANGGVMAADLGDASGRYLDLEAYARWQALRNFDLMAGYRYLVIDAYGQASSRDFDADVDLHGWFVTAGITF